MAVWTSGAVYAVNQPPGTVKLGQAPDEASGMTHPRVEMPCVLLDRRMRAALEREPSLWLELKRHALRALDSNWAGRADDWPMQVYDEGFAVIETWTRRLLRAELGA